MELGGRDSGTKWSGVCSGLSWAHKENLGGCHQGKEQQLHISMTVLSPAGKARDSRAQPSSDF